MSYIAEIISVGTEILLGNIANTDARDVSEVLSQLGINVYFHTVVGDNPNRVHQAVEVAKSRADIIITTGGLGPTYDDLTKQTLAAAFGRELYFDEKAAQNIKELFEKRLHGVPMTENNLQQAYLPVGCTVFYNSCGTAPGCGFEAEGKHVLMLPGPPSECRAMLKTGVIPYLTKLSGQEIRSHNINIFGMGESSVEDKLHDLMVGLTNPTLAPYAKEGEVMLRVTALADTDEAADSMMRPVLDRVQAAIGSYIYGIDAGTLEETVFHLLKDRGLTLSTAESCTGGLISKRLTDIPGSSSVLKGGVVSYSNEAKIKFLGVPAGLIEKHGAVSHEVAQAMAEGIRVSAGTDLGVSVTGIAGPDSDGTGKPVGLVYVGLSAADGTLLSRELYCGTPRQRCRTMAANYALDTVRRHVLGLNMPDKFM